MKRAVSFAVIGLFVFFGISLVLGSLVLNGVPTYNSTNTNITQENSFSHLNISDSNLLVYFPFDIQENSSNITYDYAGRFNDGTLKNGPVWNSSYSPYGGDYIFDGSNDYVDLGSELGLSDNESFTISAWINTRNTTAFQSIFSTGAGGGAKGIGFLYTSPQKLYIEIYGESGGRQTFSSNNNILVSGWNHVGVVFNATNLSATFFSNGTFDKTVVITEPTSIVYAAPVSIGSLRGSSTYFNGSIDEFMFFNKSLSASEISSIYSNQSARFYNTGDMLFQNNNLGTNNTINISINNCSTLMNSYIQAKVNSGSFVNFTNCNITNYPASGDLGNANLTIRLGTDSYDFYSPLSIGNITLTSLDNQSPIVSFVSPTDGTLYTSSNLDFIINTNENSSCNYSLDSGTTNVSLIANSTGTGHTRNSTFSNGDYILNLYCQDLSGNLNSSANVLFTVAVPASATANSTEEGSSNYILGVFSPSEASLKKGYSVNVKKNQKVVINSTEIKIVSVSLEMIQIDINDKTYSFGNSTKIDLDSDGFYDVEVSNKGVNGNYVNLEFKLIHEEVPAGTQEDQTGNVVLGNNDSSNQNKNKTWEIILIVVLVVLVVGLVLVNGAKNSKKK